MSSAKPAKKITMMISKAALTGRSVPSLKNHTASISASRQKRNVNHLLRLIFTVKAGLRPPVQRSTASSAHLIGRAALRA